MVPAEQNARGLGAVIVGLQLVQLSPDLTAKARILDIIGVSQGGHAKHRNACRNRGAYLDIH